MKNYILSYGTLRSGNVNPGENENNICRDNEKIYNYQRFGAGTQKFIKKLKLKGFSLYDLGYYPCAVEDQNGEITVELQEITCDKAWRNLRSMELGAGYQEKEITTENIKACLFVMDNLDKNRFLKIVNGDWCKE